MNDDRLFRLFANMHRQEFQILMGQSKLIRWLGIAVIVLGFGLMLLNFRVYTLESRIDSIIPQEVENTNG